MTLHITLVYSPSPRQVRELALELSDSATVQQALDASGLAELYPALDLRAAQIGIWGSTTTREHPLQERDRVEVYRALKVNPKVARRERFAQQGRRGTGLFAKK